MKRKRIQTHKDTTYSDQQPITLEISAILTFPVVPLVHCCMLNAVHTFNCRHQLPLFQLRRQGGGTKERDGKLQVTEI